ncbi:MAG TPA: ABC transporter permease subunit [Chthonomonadaceae bacterium]|nr:ABC transporter permease subunit [Chthonomonadaceae bacterium]
MENPVFLNELRQSLFRRKPLLAIGLWALVTALLIWLSQFAGLARYPLSWIPAFALPLIVPPFAAGAFAKEYEQQTWQDLYLTRLTNAQVVIGKFCASLLLVGLAVFSCVPAMLLMLLREGSRWAAEPGWWMITVTLKLLLSASLYVLLGMTCSRYSSNRRTALVWSYIALFLYGLLGAAVWATTGQEFAQNEAYATGDTEILRTAADPIGPGFMSGLHLIFCCVVGLGTFILLWVSLSEQRGYKGDGRGAEVSRAWQPISRRSAESR